MKNLRLKRPILPIEEWINDPYYVGKEVDSIYPFWKERTIEFFNSKYNKFIGYGSYRLGKGHVMGCLWLFRILYEISCCENFLEQFHLSPSTKLKFAFISFSKDKARSTGLDKMIRMIDSIPYFNEVCPRNKNLKSKIDLGFAEIYCASNVSHLTGEDLYGVIFDEADFVKSAAGEEYEKAKEIFLEAQIRGHATYSIGGKHYGFYGLLSSAQYETSFTEQQLKSAEENDDAYVVKASVFEVKPWSFAKEKFRVFLGAGEIPPFILDEEQDLSTIKNLINTTYGITFDQFIKNYENRIKLVPVDLKPYFVNDISYAIKTLVGEPIRRSGLFLKNHTLLHKAYFLGLKSPLLVEVPQLSLFGSEVIQDFVNEDILLDNYEAGQRVYIHIDQSKSGDRTGFGAFFKTSSGRIRSLLYMAIYYDDSRKEIDISKVEDIVYWFIDLGIPIGKLTYDQYASIYASQSLKKRVGREKVETQSVDKDDTQYMVFLFLLKKGLIDMYRYLPFEKELFTLEHDAYQNKVLKAKDGSDDVSQAVVGAIYNLFQKDGMSRDELVYTSLNKEEVIDDFYLSALADASVDTYYDDLLVDEKEIDAEYDLMSGLLDSD